MEESSDLKHAQVNLKETVSALDKAVRQNIIHKNTAARTKARLSKLVNKLSSPSEEKMIDHFYQTTCFNSLKSLGLDLNIAFTMAMGSIPFIFFAPI